MNSEAVAMTANPRKTRGARTLGRVDIAALRSAVLEIPDSVWDAENADKPNRFEALDSTRHIVFRFVSSFTDWRRFYDRPIWKDWRHLVEPVIDQATAPYGYARAASPRVMLARMASGGIICPHRDANPAAKWPHKIHVPLVTNPFVSFVIDGVEHRFPEGEAVEVDNMAVHAVRNDGPSPRIHLIFEYYDQDQPDPRWIGPLR